MPQNQDSPTAAELTKALNWPAPLQQATPEQVAELFGDDAASIDQPLHSPGPWMVLSHKDDFTLRFGDCVLGQQIWQATGFRVAFTERQNVGPAEEHKNALLIAAAPDLLAALHEIAKGEGRFSVDPLTHASNTIESMQKLALDAIAKAEGR